MIELQNVHKRLGDRDILKGLSVKIPKGVNYVLMGPSGTGKSVTPVSYTHLRAHET